jgi:hypothetical protein
MQTFDNRLIQTILTSGAIGGLVMLSVVAILLAFDILSIATLVGDSANREIVSAVLLVGALTKGVAFGSAAGVAFYASNLGATRAVPVRIARDRNS